MNDELEIRTLVARYSDGVATRDAGTWGSTWAEDADWQIVGFNAHGRTAIVELWQKLMAGFPWVVQLMGSGTVEVQGDTGKGRWYLFEFAKSAEGKGLLNVGVYHDDYRRTAAGWRFACRRFDLLYSGPPDLSATAMPLVLPNGTQGAGQ